MQTVCVYMKVRIYTYIKFVWNVSGSGCVATQEMREMCVDLNNKMCELFLQIDNMNMREWWMCVQ